MPALPISLRNEPLLDAIFEVRFDSDFQLSEILPGMFFAAFGSKLKIMRLPAAEIPQPLRASDPNLAYVPITRLDFDGFFVSVGDKNLSISCKLPYPKWPAFKQFIIDVCAKIASFGLNAHVNRYSIKYVNLLQGGTTADQIKKIKMAMSVGELDFQAGNFSLQLQAVEGSTLHIVSVITGAVANLPDNTQLSGTILDIDSIENLNRVAFIEFVSDLGVKIEKLRQANKEKFFSALKPEAIEEMGPHYG
ncbi:TIGR04255 family protein [Agrobacterium fabrum]|uniref:TIGR04255 family protein n=1 Tax=Agrobacterium fabrum TaxID=1176649 RepID=UPI003BA16853